MRRLLLVVAALVALSGCKRTATDAARAVRAYDDELVRAFRMSDSSRVPEVATRQEADRVLVLVDLKASNRLVLDSTLERFEVLSARAAPDGKTAEVDTAERWRYFDRPLDPGRTAGAVILSEMRMRYALVREGGRWKVADVTTLGNEILSGRPRQAADSSREAGSPR